MRPEQHDSRAVDEPLNPTEAAFARSLDGRRACRVLVVDDDELVRARLAAVLQAANYLVATASSGEEALRVLAGTKCHIVLTDWQMPDMDGLALCRQLRRALTTDYIYVLMLTVRATKHDRLAGLLAGADDYVNKSATMEEILARLEIGRRITRAGACVLTRAADTAVPTHQDATTGAHNLSYLLQQLPRELARAQRHGHALSVLSCGIAGIGRVNDRCGRHVGDDLLRTFVARAGGCTRKADWIARTGPLEFNVVLPETAEPGARCVASKLTVIFSVHPLSRSIDPIDLTVSTAVTAVDAEHDIDSTLRITALLRAAERRLHAAGDGPEARRGAHYGLN